MIKASTFLQFVAIWLAVPGWSQIVAPTAAIAQRLRLQRSLLEKPDYNAALAVTASLTRDASTMELSGLRDVMDACNYYYDAGLTNESKDLFARLFTESLAKTNRTLQCYAFDIPTIDRLSDSTGIREALKKDRRYCTADEHRNRAAVMINGGRIAEAAEEIRRQVATNPYILDTYLLARFIQRSYQQPGMQQLYETYFSVEDDIVPKCELWDEIHLTSTEVSKSRVLSSTAKLCSRK